MSRYLHPLPFLCLCLTTAHAVFPPLKLETVSSGQLLAPVAITHAGDGSGRLFIVEQRGQIRVIKNGKLLPTPFLDISSLLVTERAGFDERGLLSLAFHPDYSNSGQPGEGRFYLYYSAPSPNAPGSAASPVDHQSIIAEYQVSPTDSDLANPATSRILLTFDQPQFNHDGGQLAFGPTDNLLYIATGDGGSSDDNNAGHTGGSAAKPSGVLGNAQDLTKLLGKVLRIDPLGNNSTNGQYGLPATNPFFTGISGEQKEIYAYGLRNPWRFSFDDGPGGTNRLFLADVGQGKFEEINLIESGKNYGWRNREGSFAFDATAPATGPFTDPIAEYAHPGQAGATGLQEIGISVTGGHVYRGSAIPALVGKYIFADWSSGFGAPNGTLLGLEESPPGTFTLSVLSLQGGNPIGRYIAALGEDENGEIYLATKTTLSPSSTSPGGIPNGAILKLISTSTTALTPDQDNTIFSELTTNSAGADTNIFAGRILNSVAFRRALVRFDLTSIPPASTVTTASLSLHMNKTVTGSLNFSLHAATRDWGEEGSNASGAGGQGAAAEPGDATWSHAFFNTIPWTTAGGDFTPSASATTAVNGTGSYPWISASLTSDIQDWVNSPTTNNGWLLIGDESTPSAKRFSSRENAVAANRPTLSLTYFASLNTTNRQIWDAKHFLPGEFVDDHADLDFDLLNNLLEYAFGFDPHVVNDPSTAITAVLNAAGDEYNLSFRRDPRATDIIYQLQVSSDLANWLVIAESDGGATPTGSGLLTDDADGTDPIFRRVTARDPGTPPIGGKRFSRLAIVPK